MVLGGESDDHFFNYTSNSWVKNDENEQQRYNNEQQTAGKGTPISSKGLVFFKCDIQIQIEASRLNNHDIASWTVVAACLRQMFDFIRFFKCAVFFCVVKNEVMASQNHHISKFIMRFF